MATPERHSAPAALTQGANLLKLRRVALDYGVNITCPARTGEERWTHPAIERPMTFNRRKKAASRAAVGWLRKVVAGADRSPEMGVS